MSAEAYALWMRLVGSVAGGFLLFGVGLGLAYCLWGRNAKPGGPDGNTDPPDAGEK